MTILIDESVHFGFVELLRTAFSFRIVSIAEDFSSMSDEKIISVSMTFPAIIITEDKDFGELVFYKQMKVYAVILLRYDKTERHLIEEKLIDLLIYHFSDLADAFTVITSNKIRIRKLNF